MNRETIYALIVRLDSWLESRASAVIALLLAAGLGFVSYMARRECSISAVLGVFAVIFALVGWFGLGDTRNGHAQQ